MKWIVTVFFLLPTVCCAENTWPMVPLLSDNTGHTYSLSIQLLMMMTALTFMPAAFLAMTSFTRIIIVLGILRQAMGMPQTPNNQILIGIAFFLSFFIMSPVIHEINMQALQPYTTGQLAAMPALDKASFAMKNFMLQQTRTNDLVLFEGLSQKGHAKVSLPERLHDLPMSIVMPAFITSEIKTAFQIGFLIFIPFLIIDFVVASVLMAMGMMMLSPMIISLPFKIMLFVLVDGWTLILGTLASSFGE